MEKPIPIQKLAAQLGLTSRTLRHWEAERLFQSQRDEASGWRVYDTEAVLCIHFTALLRRLGLSIGGSWKTLQRLLAKHERYTADRTRLCFEEHIRNDNPEGSGNEYNLRLLEPIQLK